MTSVQGFSTKDNATVLGDVAEAKQIAMRCVNAMIYRPGGPLPMVQTLLWYTFSLPKHEWRDPSPNWEKAGEVRARLSSFGARLDRTPLKFAATQPVAKDEIQLGAYVRGNENAIYLTQKYLDNASKRQRAATLIHEYIHLVQRKPGHPGGTMVMFGGPTHLNVPFAEAYENPYCYQYLAEWIA